MARMNNQGNVGLFVIDSLSPVGATPKTQVITRTATGGTVDIAIGSTGETLTGVSIVAATTAAGLKAALEAAASIDTGDITVTGSTGGPFTVTGNIPDLDIDDTNATGGTVTIAITQAVASDQYAPSASAIAAGLDITEAVRTYAGFAFEGTEIDVPDLNSRYPKTIPGNYGKASPSLTIYRNDDPASVDAVTEAKLVEDYEGFLVRSLGNRTPQAGDEVQVWPIRVMSATPMGDADATGGGTAQTTMIKLSVPDAPDLHCTVA